MESKIKKAEEAVIKILTKDKPKNSKISKKEIAILANTLVKNYLTKKDIH